jgi:Lar family restriction alleviation protein
MFPKITSFCPFCGMQPETEDDHATNLKVISQEIQGTQHFWVSCYVGCGSRGPVSSSEVEAIEEWNKRVNQ